MAQRLFKVYDTEYNWPRKKHISSFLICTAHLIWKFWFYSLIYVKFETYRIRLIKRTVRVEVGKIFCRRGFVKHQYNHTPQLVPIAVLCTATRNGSYGRHLYTFSFSLLAWTLAANKPVCNKVVDWSISQSCFGAEYRESVKELQTEQNSILVSRQGKRKGMWFGFGYFWGEI